MMMMMMMMTMMMTTMLTMAMMRTTTMIIMTMMMVMMMMMMMMMSVRSSCLSSPACYPLALLAPSPICDLWLQWLKGENASQPLVFHGSGAVGTLHALQYRAPSSPAMSASPGADAPMLGG